MMKYFLLIVLFFVFFGCTKQTDSSASVSGSDKTLNIQVIPSYNNAPLLMYKNYVYNGKTIQFTKFSFICSRFCDDVKTNCDNRQLKFDFSATDSTSALKGITNSISISNTNIQNLVIGFGVDANANALIPAKQLQSSPLANGLNYWDAWDSFIFLRIQGMYDKDGDGILETPFGFDTGGNEIYSEKTYALNNYIPNPNATSVNLLFSIDLVSVLNTTDFNVITQTSKAVDIPVMNVLMTNLKNALVYKAVTIK